MGRSQSKGAAAEDLALQHLERAGLRLRERNFRIPRGEIDLIMEEGGQTIFVEVRYRRSQAFGGAAESVNYAKQRRIAIAAAVYLGRFGSRPPPCRFDVLALTGEGGESIEWIRDAFRIEPGLFG